MSNQSTEIVKEQPSALAQLKQRLTEDQIAHFAAMSESGRIDLPPNYSVANALQAAWMKLQEVVDKDKRPVLATCTESSIIRSLRLMVSEGMNVDKNQGYFIAHNKLLTWRRSYFGDQALAKRTIPELDIHAVVVREGDNVRTEVVNGIRVVKSHSESDDIFSGKERAIIGAYAIASLNCKVIASVFMTRGQIEESWKMNPQYKPDGGLKIHSRFEEDMCKRTVLRKVSGQIYNTSDDSHLTDRLKRIGLTNTASVIDVDAEELAHVDVIDMDTEPIATQVPADADEKLASEHPALGGGTPFDD